MTNPANQTQKVSKETSQKKADEFSLKSLELQHVVAIVLTIITFVAFFPLLGNEFINYDDNLYITDNPHVKAGVTIESIEWAFTTGHTGNWHPLTWISLMIDSQIYGLNAWGYHLTNLLLHFANTLFLFFIIRRITGGTWQSAFVAALFALHPLHVESVAWAAERKDVLSTLFWMLTMWAYVRYTETLKVDIYLLTALFLVLGLMAKPMLVTLPVVMLLLDYWPLGRLQLKRSRSQGMRDRQMGPGTIRRKMSFVQLVLEKIPFFVLAIGSSIATFIAQREGGSVSSLEVLPINLRLANAVVSYVTYIEKLLWPSGLVIFYPHPYDKLAALNVAGSALLLIFLTALALWFIRQKPYVAFGWFWYVGTLIPVIGIVQVGAQAMADRYTYVPLIGLFIIAAWGIPEFIGKWSSRKTIFAFGGVTLLVPLAVTTFSQVRLWHDNILLFRYTLQSTSDNWTAHLQLGIAETARQNYDEAVKQYTEALRLRPYHVDVHYGLGVALAGLGKNEEAVTHYNEALRLRPDYARGHNDLGVALGKLGRLDEAITHYSEALRLDSEYIGAHNNLGIAFGMQGKNQEAVAQFSDALRLDPGFADAHNNLGIILAREGKLTEAVSHYSEALRLKPDHSDAKKNLDLALAAQAQKTESLPPKTAVPSTPPDSATVEFNLGLALYNDRKLDKAVPHFRKALQLKSDYWEASYNLGVIYHNQGKLKDAIEFYSRAVHNNPNYPEGQYNLGVAYHSQGDLGKASARYREAIRLKPTYAQAYNNLGVAYFSQGKYKEAIAQYTKALELKPDYEEARKNLEVVKTVTQGQNIILTPKPQKQ